jgi:hypothetical protein
MLILVVLLMLFLMIGAFVIPDEKEPIESRKPVLAEELSSGDPEIVLDDDFPEKVR